MMESVDLRPPAIFLMGPTASGKTALACALADRFPLQFSQRRFGAGLSRPRHRQRQARCRHAGAPSASPDRHPRSGAAVFRGRFPHRRAGRDERDHRGRQRAVAGRWHRFVFPRAGGRFVRIAGRRSGAARGTCRRGRADRLAGAACALGRARSGRGARIRPGDAQRIQRALEVIALTGQPLSTQQVGGDRGSLPWRVLKLALVPARSRRRCTSASRSASMRCSPPASSTRRGGCMPIRDTACRPAGDARGRLSPGLAVSGRRHRRRHVPRPRDLRHAPAGQAPAHLAAQANSMRAWFDPDDRGVDCEDGVRGRCVPAFPDNGKRDRATFLQTQRARSCETEPD